MSLGYLNMPSDIFKYKENYLANLNADIDNINQTYNAVRLKLSGNTTPQQPVDTRTVEDKYIDVERAKIELRSKLMSLTDGREVGLIMSKLGDDDVFFALQNFQELYNIIKPKFSLGCPMALFMDIFDRFIAKRIKRQE